MYKKVLEIDPENEIAKERLKYIEKFYYDTAVEYLDKGYVKGAEKYVERLKEVNPESAYLEKLKEETMGRLVWEYETGDSVYSSPAVSGNMVYVGSWDGYVYALDKYIGKVRWEYETGDSVDSSPAVSGDTVYVGSMDGYVYAISTGDPSAPPWPMFRHDPQHTGCTDCR